MLTTSTNNYQEVPIEHLPSVLIADYIRCRLWNMVREGIPDSTVFPQLLLSIGSLLTAVQHYKEECLALTITLKEQMHARTMKCCVWKCGLQV